MSAPVRGPQLLSAYLETKGCAQEALAQELGVHQSTLSRWVSGKQRPDIDCILKLRDLCEIPVEAWATSYTPPSTEAAA